MEIFHCFYIKNIPLLQGQYCKPNLNYLYTTAIPKTEYNVVIGRPESSKMTRDISGASRSVSKRSSKWKVL